MAPGFVCNIRVCGVVDSELWGMFKGLEVAWNHGCRKVYLASDSKLAMDTVVNGVEGSHSAAPMVERIRRLVKRRWDVEIAHTYREANKLKSLTFWLFIVKSTEVKGKSSLMSIALFACGLKS
ncbi:ribonuclease H [Senna tora]|uniref:Ribonuclease H n=1 Tax=Senna tora TaxID=362788 RepID=A0A835CMJ6_9FABA|nr:ribonuclease H [Senna tora]